MRTTHRPTPLRLAGFLATALGALLVGVGSVLTWATVTVGSGGVGLPPLETRGIDTSEGRIALAAGLLMLAAIPAMRLSGSAGRRLWAALVLVASLVAGGFALADALRPESKLGLGAAADAARQISDRTGLPFDVLKATLEEVTTVDLEPGPSLVVVGGALGTLGGALSLVWAGRRREIDALLPPDHESPTARHGGRSSPPGQP